MTSPTLIIGGGWSGLAAAVTLTQHNHSVHLLESAKQLGGRARNVQWHDQTIDNGQHLMIGAYEHMLAMIDTVGLNEHDIFHRIPMDITLHDSHYPPLTLSTHSRLPFSLALAWNLIRSAGFMGLYHVAQLQASIPELLKQPDINVQTWLIQTKQSPRLIKQLWEPLCLASLNTSIEIASAHVMATVLQDSIGKGRLASDLLIPRVPLANVFPHAAANSIRQHGSKISIESRVQQLLVVNGAIKGVQLKGGSQLMSDHVILATAPSHAAKLIKPYITKIYNPDEAPICTVYLQYSKETRLKKPLFGMTGTISQWIFDRSDQTPGLMAIVISSYGKHDELDNTQLVHKVSQEVHQLFPELPNIVEHSLVIREKRATFACTFGSNLLRPTNHASIKGLYLAGDYIANSYPATLEGAIRNGESAALSLLENEF